MNLMEGIVPEYSRKGVIRGPSGSSVTGIVPTNAYPTSISSAYVVIGANGESVYERLMNAIGRPDLVGPNYAHNHRRVARQAEIEEAISAWTSQRTPEEICKAMDQARVPVGRISNIKDIMENEHVRERGMIEKIHIPGPNEARSEGSTATPAHESDGWDLEVARVHPLLECDSNTRWAGPDLGQHNREVFFELLGLTQMEIDRLQSEGIIGHVGN